MFSFLFDPMVMAIGGAVLALILIAIFLVKRYKIADPDQAIIVTGRRGKQSSDLSGQKVVTGGGVFVAPFVQKSFSLSLRSRQLNLNTTAQTENGITITARAVAVVKVGGTEEMIRHAAQRFLSQQDEIETSTQEVLSGSLRGIIGGLTVETIIRDRARIAADVLTAAEDALTKQGLIVDTLQIQEINDTENYIANLGRPEAAKVLRAAEIADVQAKQAAREAQIAADASVLERDREYKLRDAAVRQETDMALAQAEAAKPREEAIQRQRIVEAEEVTAQKTAALREAQLNATVRKEADAEAYRVTTIAQAKAEENARLAKGEAEAAIAAAEADKKRRTLAAEADERAGLAEQVTRSALAEALRAEGQAEADAIRAKGAAEAAAIEGRRKALSEHAEAVLQQELLAILPKIAHELALGYGNIGNITVVSNDGPTGAVTGEIAGGLASLTETVKSVTGIDLPGAFNSAVGGAVAGGAAGEALKKAQFPQRPLARDIVEVDEAPTEGEKALTAAFTARIQEAIKNGDLEKAEKLKNELRESGISFN